MNLICDADGQAETCISDEAETMHYCIGACLLEHEEEHAANLPCNNCSDAGMPECTGGCPPGPMFGPTCCGAGSECAGFTEELSCLETCSDSAGAPQEVQDRLDLIECMATLTCDGSMSMAQATIICRALLGS